MDPVVKKFLDAAKAAERKRFEQERDCILISLGLIDPDKTRREYNDLDYYTHEFPDWDPEKKKYYRTINGAVDVTDEEFEEIRKYAPKVTVKETVKELNSTQRDVDLKNGPEKFLAVINGIALALGIISAIFILFYALSAKGVGGYFVLTALGILLVSFVSWAIVKVMLNISNNLHMINSKLK
jgi:hypothetical protein